MATDLSPKQDAIADAVISLAAEKGISAISLRNVAKEAGISMGQVQYYFHTAAEMISAAVTVAVARLQEFATQYVLANIGDGSPLAQMQAHGFSLINSDPVVRTSMRVLGQFESQYERDTQVGALLARNDPTLQQMSQSVIKAGQANGSIKDDVDPEQEARLYWVLVGALSVEVAMDAITVERARDVFSYYLKRLSI